VEGYLGIVARKTGALFAWLGAVLSEQSPLPHRKDDPPLIGLDAGRVLQIIDDVHDFTLDKDTAGKEPGQDFLLGKLTLPALLALEDEALRPRFLEFWNRVPRDRAAAAEAVVLLREGGCFEAARAKAREALDSALQRASALPGREGADGLARFLEAMSRREF
ncbi:MAG TPA: hypothetical protein DCM05_17475, partial [Elusimicrobia bacterium]|nr:hypothetical protein [Elusimicrobiota bacterium]